MSQSTGQGGSTQPNHAKIWHHDFLKGYYMGINEFIVIFENISAFTLFGPKKGSKCLFWVKLVWKRQWRLYSCGHVSNLIATIFCINLHLLGDKTVHFYPEFSFFTCTKGKRGPKMAPKARIFSTIILVLLYVTEYIKRAIAHIYILLRAVRKQQNSMPRTLAYSTNVCS